jgi:DNA-binding MarR family transcriptional regulator
VTQRSVAERLGIALGLANAYLKRCVRKGFIKVSHIPRKRYAYYLTPQGLSEKTRLTAEFFSNSFRFFRVARKEYTTLLQGMAERQVKRVAFCGVGELSEIASLCARDVGMEVVGVLNLGGVNSISNQVGHPVVTDLRALGSFDAILITDFVDARATLETLRAVLPADCIFAPHMLGLSRPSPCAAEQ